MSSPETPAFLLLKFRTCDDLDNVRFTLYGTENEKPGLWLDLVVLSSEYWLTQPVLTTRMTLPLPGGERRLALVAVAPAPDATETGYRVYQWPKPEPKPAAPATPWERQADGKYVHGLILEALDNKYHYNNVWRSV